MAWLKQFFSADNSGTDSKTVLGTFACCLGLAVYSAYAIKGLFIQWPMPEAVKDITEWVVLGGLGLTGAGILNQKLGVSCPPPDCGTTPPMPEPPKGPVG